MNLLASCNPKDLSQCDSVQRARDVLQRPRELAKENLVKAGRDDFARHANSLGGVEALPQGVGESRPALRCRRKLSILMLRKVLLIIR
jgi:hypothetical protein